ncbi:MAG: phosphotransferase [Wenzhouxiangella sp.]
MSGTGPNRHPDAQLSAALDAWSHWDLALTGRPQVVDAVKGGRTNRSFRMTGPGLDEDLLLRLNHPDPASLGIDRTMEREILRRTAAAGISRPCLYWDPDDHFVVFPWLEARTWGDADLASPSQRARLRALLARLGEITLDCPRRDYQAYLLGYWRQLEQAGATDPELTRRWRKFQPRLHEFAQAPWPTRLVHHDLIPANVLESGGRLYLIDWEYAAPGHPDIDVWTIEPSVVCEPFIAELMDWINTLWERLVDLQAQYSRST